jgi:hypothetical protein
VRNIETGGNSCLSVWTSLYRVYDIVVFLHSLLCLTFSMAVYIRKGAIVLQVLVNTSELNTRRSRIHPPRLPLPICFNSSSGHSCKTRTQTAYRCKFHGKTECLQLILTVHVSHKDLATLHAISYASGVVAITYVHACVCARPLHFTYY